MHMSICLAEMITNLLFAGKESSLQTCNYAKGRNQRRNNANDCFGKGFHELNDHVLNLLMTGKVTHRVTDKVTTVTLSRMRAEG